MKNRQTQFSAVIFDMDGVLIDSEMHWTETARKFNAARGLPYNADIKAMFTGGSMKENMHKLKSMFHLAESEEQLVTERTKMTDFIYKREANAMPGVTELLRTIRTAGLRTAVASGSYLYRIEEIVGRFGWQEYFDVLASTDHVNFVGKPAPDVFLYAAQQLELAPDECVVIEDSVNGVRAAKAAGMACVAALDDRWSYGDYSDADIVVKSLTDPQLYQFIGLAV